MDLTHSFSVPAPIETTWAAFNDLESIAPCMPGATVQVTDDSTFTGTIKVKLGPISLVYGGSGEYVERDEASRTVIIEAKGKDKRGQGTAGATVMAVMSPEGDGTRVEVTTDLAVTGKPAQFGRGVMQDVSDKLLGQFVGCISARLTSSGEEDEDASGDETTAMPGKHAADPAEGPDTTVEGAPEQAGSTTSRPTTPASSTRAARAVDEMAEVDLAATVAPVLLKRYGVPAAIAFVLVAVIVWIRRR